jgi:adenosylmethionine-8-amino-7-oxononanoate aminotransferase
MPPLDAPFPASLAESELAAYWLPFTANRAFKRRPRLIDRAEGMHYYTPDGRDAAFFGEDLVIRVVGDTLVLAPALVISEALIAAIVGKVAHFLQGLR